MKFDWRIYLQALCTKFFLCLFPIAFAPNRPSSIFWVATFPVNKHTKSYCLALNGFIQLLSSITISDFTLASSLAILVFWRSVCTELDLLRFSVSLSCFKKILRNSETNWSLWCPRLSGCPYWPFPRMFDQLEPYQRGLGHKYGPRIHQT